MAIDPDVQRVIDKINRRIESLQKTKETLLREFAVNSLVGKQEIRQRPEETLPIFGNQGKNGIHTNKPMTRKEAILDFLRRNGPSTRGEIIKGLNIPRGTAGFYLRDKATFMKNRDEKWTVKPDIS